MTSWSRRMQGELNQLAAQDASLAGQFTGAYPPLAQLRAKENALKSQLNLEVQNSIKRHRNHPISRRSRRSTNSTPRCSASAP